jgi:hypothetical protein
MLKHEQLSSWGFTPNLLYHNRDETQEVSTMGTSPIQMTKVLALSNTSETNTCETIKR